MCDLFTERCGGEKDTFKDMCNNTSAEKSCSLARTYHNSLFVSAFLILGL